MKLIQTLRSGAAFLALGCALLALPLAARAAAPEKPLPEPAGEQLEQQNDSEWMRLNCSAIRVTVPSGASAVTEQLYVADSWYGGRVTWTSSDPDVAVVSADGMVTAVADGSARITATTPEGRSASCDVYVGQAAKDYDENATLMGVVVVGGMAVLFGVLVMAAVSAG